MNRALPSAGLLPAIGLAISLWPSLAHAQAPATPPPAGPAEAAPEPPVVTAPPPAAPTDGTAQPYPYIPPPPANTAAPSYPPAGPPPNTYGGQYGQYNPYGPYPSYGYPPPPPHGVFRPVSLTLSVGPGVLNGYGFDGRRETNLALSYSVFRLGFGVAPNFSLFIGYEGAGSSSTRGSTGTSSWLSQNIWSFGLQYHLHQRFYLRAGAGIGTVGDDTNQGTFTSDNGTAFVAGVGYEFVQTPDIALGLEASGSVTKYAFDEWWQTAGVNLTLAFF